MIRGLSIGALLAAAVALAAAWTLVEIARPARVQPHPINREGKSDRLKAPGLDLRVFATCRSA